MTQHSLERALLDEKIRNNCRLKHRIKKSSLTWNKIPKRLQRFVFGLLIPWMTAINDSAIVPAPWSKHLSAVSQISHQKRHKNEDSEALVLSLFLFLFRNKPLCIIQVHFIFKSKMRHISYWLYRSGCTKRDNRDTRNAKEGLRDGHPRPGC